jgi:DNA-binding response OmpR family regulator
MEERATVLVAVSEPDTAILIARALHKAGCNVVLACEGLQILLLIKKYPPDLLILDSMMRGIDALKICRYVRKETMSPILLLTDPSQFSEKDVIKALELGVDETLPKPFSTDELMLRVQALLRVCGNHKVKELKSGPLRIDLERRSVTINGSVVNLTPLEYRLLVCLVANAGRVLSWQTLLKRVWGFEPWQGNPEMVKVAIHRLRRKLEPALSQPLFIHTVRGWGYYFENRDSAH